MPILLSAEDWIKTGRWTSAGDELIRVVDRHQGAYCLAPTHEEPITALVAAEVSSARQLPLRLYQIGARACLWFRVESRGPDSFCLFRGVSSGLILLFAYTCPRPYPGKKYRDEMRPRFGLLRSREFVMKDLYTFDVTREQAFATYDAVSDAYFRCVLIERAIMISSFHHLFFDSVLLGFDAFLFNLFS